MSGITPCPELPHFTLSIVYTNNRIQCQNVTNLKIEGLTFILNYVDREITALLELINCHNVFILKTTFQGSADVHETRTMIFRHSTATIKNSIFEGTNMGLPLF